MPKHQQPNAVQPLTLPLFVIQTLPVVLQEKSSATATQVEPDDDVVEDPHESWMVQSAASSKVCVTLRERINRQLIRGLCSIMYTSRSCYDLLYCTHHHQVPRLSTCRDGCRPSQHHNHLHKPEPGWTPHKAAFSSKQMLMMSTYCSCIMVHVLR